MKVIKQTYHVKSPVQDVWQALIDPKVIDDWGGGPSKMSEMVGFEFELWGGDIHGKNIEVIPNKNKPDNTKIPKASTGVIGISVTTYLSPLYPSNQHRY